MPGRPGAYDTSTGVRLSPAAGLASSGKKSWHAATEHSDLTGYVDISQIPLSREMNERLKDDLSGAAFHSRFAVNVAQLKSLAAEIVAHSGLSVPLPFRPTRSTSVRAAAFASVFTSQQPRRAADSQPNMAAEGV